MRKRKLNLIIISVLFLLLLCILFFLIFMPNDNNNSNNNHNNTSEVQKNLEAVINMSDKAISHVKVKNQGSTYSIKAVDKDDKKIYVLDENNVDKTNQSMTSELVNTLSNLKPVQVVAENADNLNDFGLSSPRATLNVIFDNGDNLTLYLGNDTPINTGAYMKLNDESKVYMISNEAKEIFLNKQSDYESKDE